MDAALRSRIFGNRKTLAEELDELDRDGLLKKKAEIEQSLAEMANMGLSQSWGADQLRYRLSEVNKRL